MSNTAIAIIVLVIIAILHFLSKGIVIKRIRMDRDLTEDQKSELKAIDKAYRKEMARSEQLQKEHNKTIDRLNYWRESVLTDNLKDKHDY